MYGAGRDEAGARRCPCNGVVAGGITPGRLGLQQALAKEPPGCTGWQQPGKEGPSGGPQALPPPAGSIAGAKGWVGGKGWEGRGKRTLAFCCPLLRGRALLPVVPRSRWQLPATLPAAEPLPSPLPCCPPGSVRPSTWQRLGGMPRWFPTAKPPGTKPQCRVWGSATSGGAPAWLSAVRANLSFPIDLGFQPHRTLELGGGHSSAQPSPWGTRGAGAGTSAGVALCARFPPGTEPPAPQHPGVLRPLPGPGCLC